MADVTLTVTYGNVTVGNMPRHSGRPTRTRHERQASAGLREQQKADRREALLDAAVEAIRTHGPNASMEDLAAAAGVTKPILYRHFGDRNGLVLALAARFANRLLAELQEALSAPVIEPRDFLVNAIDAFLRFLEKEPDVYRFLVQRAQSGEAAETHAVLDSFLQRVGQQVAVVLGDQLRLIGADSGGAEPIAHGVVGFVYGAGDWWVERRSMSRARLVDYLATTLWSGFQGMGIGGAPAPADALEQGNH